MRSNHASVGDRASQGVRPVDLKAPFRVVDGVDPRGVDVAPRALDRLVEEERSATPKELIAALQDEYSEIGIPASNIQDALDKARECSSGEDLICVAGSLYLIGGARGILLGELIQ